MPTIASDSFATLALYKFIYLFTINHLGVIGNRTCLTAALTSNPQHCYQSIEWTLCKTDDVAKT